MDPRTRDRRRAHGAPATEVPEFVAADSSATRPLLQARQVLVASDLAATGEKFDLNAALSDAGLSVLDQLDQRCEPDLTVGQPLTGDRSSGSSAIEAVGQATDQA